MELVVSNLKAGLQIEALAQSALNAGVTNLELVVALNPNPPGAALYPGDYEGVSDPSLVELRSTVEAAGCRVASVVVLFDPAMTSARLGDAEVARLQFAMLMLKRAVDMARDLGAGLLRIVFSEQSLASQVGFLVRVVDAVAAYAAYVAGSERGDTVRVSYGVADRSLSEPVSDVKPQGSPGAVATKLLAMQRSLRAWNAGMDLALGELRVSADSLRCLREVNQFEVALTCVSWSGRVSGDLTPVLSALEDVYDGVCLLMPDADAIAATVTRARECLSDYAFNVRVFDRVKLSYPSSVARLLRPWGSARVEPDAAITAGTVGTWVYTYTAGEGGIATGGGLKLRFHHATNWDRFQLDAPAQSGFVTVSTTAEADLTARLFSEDAC